jgi:hypothetical protein
MSPEVRHPHDAFTAFLRKMESVPNWGSQGMGAKASEPMDQRSIER